MMQTLTECFEEYLKSFEATEFDDYALSEMKFCFFAGAIAFRMLMNQNVHEAFHKDDINAGVKRALMLDRELKDFISERERGNGKIRVN